jgi:uncharacterized membrane protein YbaN (DUF454 family)
MNKKYMLLISFVLLFTLLLVFTKPSDEKFTEWLSEKYHFDCQEKNCKDGYEIAERERKDYILFNKTFFRMKEVGQEGSLFFEGIGVLGVVLPSKAYHPGK